MLLAVDIGNTNVVGGLFDGPRLVQQWRVSTAPHRTTDELHVSGRGSSAARGLTLAPSGRLPGQRRPRLDRSYQELATQRHRAARC